MLSYIFLAISVFLINLVPALMPPTWIILAYAYVHLKLLYIPVVLIGATFATMGRIGLYFLARNYLHVFFLKNAKDNFEAISDYLNSHKKVTIPLILIYSFIPIPSNQVYIAAGIGKLDIRLMATCFFIGRLISYAFWIASAKIATNTFQEIFSRYYSRPRGIIIEIIIFILLYLISSVNWIKILNRSKSRTKHAD